MKRSVALVRVSPWSGVGPAVVAYCHKCPGSPRRSCLCQLYLMVRLLHCSRSMIIEMSMSAGEDGNIVECHDVEWISERVHQDLSQLPASYIAGKTMLRDAVVHRLDCSFVDAERIVDDMEARGYVEFERKERGPLIDPRWVWH